jgi:hypothetical protein
MNRVLSLKEKLNRITWILPVYREERDKGKSKQKPDLLLKATGLCQGPSDLAENHDKHVYE